MMVLLEELPLHPAPAGFNVIGMVKPEVMRLGIMFVIVPEVRIERATVRIYDDVPWHGAVMKSWMGINRFPHMTVVASVPVLGHEILVTHTLSTTLYVRFP